jgi:hypothetical protein
MAYNEVISESVIDATLHGKKVTITHKIRRNSDRPSKARAYVGFPTQEFCGDYPAYTGDHEEAEKAWKVYNKREIAVMREILTLAGADIADWSFSRKAGCGCGCSPGFRRRDETDYNREYYINVVVAE